MASRKWFTERLGKQIKNTHPYQGTLTVIDSNHAEVLYMNQKLCGYRYEDKLNIEDVEFKKLTKALYPKDNSKKFTK